MLEQEIPFQHRVDADESEMSKQAYSYLVRTEINMHAVNISYQDKRLNVKDVAIPSKDKRLVILCHAWKGRDDFIYEKASAIGKLMFPGCYACIRYA